MNKKRLQKIRELLDQEESDIFPDTLPVEKTIQYRQIEDKVKRLESRIGEQKKYIKEIEKERNYLRDLFTNAVIDEDFDEYASRFI